LTQWEVRIQRQAQRSMRRLPRDVLARLQEAFLELEEDPYRGEKLTGHELFKYRVGDWRIIYTIQDHQLLVLVVDVGPRGDIYRRLRRH
jgi:mRNA interferase RelE/StbE